MGLMAPRTCLPRGGPSRPEGFPLAAGTPFAVQHHRAALRAGGEGGSRARAAVPLRRCQGKLETPTSPVRLACLGKHTINQHFPDRPLRLSRQPSSY